MRHEPPGSWLLASLLRILGMLTMAGVLAAVGVTRFQDSLLYFPERAALGELAVSPAGTRLTPWPAGQRLLSIADAWHNDWPDHVDAAWWRGLMAEVPSC